MSTDRCIVLCVDYSRENLLNYFQQVHDNCLCVVEEVSATECAADDFIKFQAAGYKNIKPSITASNRSRTRLVLHFLPIEGRSLTLLHVTENSK